MGGGDKKCRVDLSLLSRKKHVRKSTDNEFRKNQSKSRKKRNSIEDGRAKEKQLGKGHRKSFNTTLNAMRIRFARLQKGRKRKKSTRDAWMSERVGGMEREKRKRGTKRRKRRNDPHFHWQSVDEKRKPRREKLPTA